MSFPSRRCSWRAISANYSAASFRNLSFRCCHHTSPPAFQAPWYKRGIIRTVVIYFSISTPAPLQIKTCFAAFEAGREATTWNFSVFVFVANKLKRRGSFHVADTERGVEAAEEAQRGRLARRPASLETSRVFKIKKPLNAAAIDPFFLRIHILWVFAFVVCMPMHFFWWRF